MPVAKPTKKTFTKKKAKVEEPKPKKVVKKAPTPASVAAPAPDEKTPVSEVPAQPVAESADSQSTEKKVSWLPSSSQPTPETQPASPHPLISDIPVTPPTSESAEAATPTQNDTWPNPSVVAKPDPTSPTVDPSVQAPPQKQDPLLSNVSATQPQPAVSDASASPNVAEVTVTHSEPSSAEGVLGSNFNGGNQVESGGKKKLLLLFIVVFLFVGLLTSGFFYYLSSQKKTLPMFGWNNNSSPTPTATPIKSGPTPTVEVVKKVDLTTYSVEVLNGSGTPGEAGKASALLETAGFEGIETGNADSYDYTDTEIQVSKDVSEEVYKAVETALKASYSVVKSKDAPTDTEYDIVIIVGSEAASDSSTSTNEEE